MFGALWVCTGVLTTGGLLLAQTAELSGLVTDPSGSAIPHADLELRNQDTGIRLRSSTNQEGLYSFTSLKPGNYDATVQADGFRTLTRDAIVLNVGDRANLDFSLQLAGTSTTITVHDEAETALNSTDPGVGTVVNQQFVGNMPLSGRSFQALIHLAPGVIIMPSAQDAQGQFSVNGQRTNTNYFTVDGVSANFGSTAAFSLGESISGSTPGLNILGGTNSLVSVDAMQEFRIQTSSYAPEYGRTPGAQVIILTKSGTNQFHGTAYDYLRNDLFDARNWFNMAPQPKPPLRQNDFGGTVGGPILKNRTFFFVSYEGLRLRQPATDVGDFLTAAARAKAPPVYQPFVNAYPLPTGPVNPDGITAPLTISYSDPSHFDATSVRVDHTTSRVMLFGRYNHAPSAQGTHFFSELDTDIADVDTATAGATIIVSASKVNDFRVNWSRSIVGDGSVMQNVLGAVAPPESALLPSFISPSSAQVLFQLPFTSGEVREGPLSHNVQRQLNLVDTFSITAGVHQFKFGVDFRRMTPTSRVFGYGYFIEPDDYPTLLAGQINFLSLETSDPITVRFYNWSLFVQDAWKLTSGLTLTYGLRWEINTPPASVTAGKPVYAVAGIFDSSPLGLIEAPLWHTRYSNFAPRLGAAWQFTPKTTIRGGFGLFYDLGYGAHVPLSDWYPYDRISNTASSTPIPFDLNSAAFQPLPFTTSISPTTGLLAVDPHLKLPVTWQWNLAIERWFGTNQALSATYVGAWGSNLLREDLVVPSSMQAATQVTYNAAYSHYDALQVQFQRRLSRGLQALVSYSLAKSTDTNSTDTGFGATAGYPQSLAASVSALQLPPAAPSDFDARHTFSAAMSAALPAPVRTGRRVLKDWVLDVVVRAHSALPLNVVYQRFFGEEGYYNVQPDYVPGQPFWIPDPNQPRGEVLNPNAFAVPVNTSGDFPRNSLRGFPFSQTDAALRRRFDINERVKLDVRAEYFNVFNHPNFADPFNLWGYGTTPDPLFGKVLPGNTLNQGLGGGGISGGQAAIYAPGGPRSAQFTLKVSF